MSMLRNYCRAWKCTRSACVHRRWFPSKYSIQNLSTSQLFSAKKTGVPPEITSTKNISISSDVQSTALSMVSNTDPSTNDSLSIESMYQRKTHLEHILLRPETYIGSVEPVTENMWVYDAASDSLVNRDIKYVPGLYKIFDEIIVNAADNKHRDKSMSELRVDINAETSEITIYNDGRGIPVVMHKVENVYVPEMIFGSLLTSSNYDDTEKKVVGGRHGYGAKLCNIFSKRFVVETSSNKYGSKFKQVWTNNMAKTQGPAEISKCESKDFTKISFSPDLGKFGMTSLDKDIVGLMCRRAYDIAATLKTVRVYLNGNEILMNGFKDYVQMHMNANNNESQSQNFVYAQVNPRWEVAATVSDKGFQQISFVNNIATTKGGRHVDHIVEQISQFVLGAVADTKKGSCKLRPFNVRGYLSVFVNCLIENPTFDSQTKECLTLQKNKFGSTCELPQKFLAQVLNSGLKESLQSFLRTKQTVELDKQRTLSKALKVLPKLEDATEAGTSKASRCTLILTEGDSAKAQAMAGLTIVGRKYYGIYPLTGKIMNVKNASYETILQSQQLKNIVSILGLEYKKLYDRPEDMRTLRYGKVMFMTDQDPDGSHIKGLLINFFHHNWPSLCRHGFLEEFITPIVKVRKGTTQELSFYSLPEFEEWKSKTENWRSWRVRYYKGLGSSDATEMKQYFTNLDRHRIRFRYDGPKDDEKILTAFEQSNAGVGTDEKTCADKRKEWLLDFLAERSRRRADGLSDVYLYEKDTKEVSFSEFIDKELTFFSNSDNERSIPSMVDGLKPSQRKVLYTCLERKIVKEPVKVNQLAGSVAGLTAYHHGETSLVGTICGMAQDFVGSNNVNLLLPKGGFGTRNAGGEDAAAGRYIRTALSPLTSFIYHPDDDHVLKHLEEDKQKIEPEYFFPVIPMILVNGALGIGTGWSTKVPCFNPRDVILNMRRLILRQNITDMIPWYRGFKGQILKNTDGSFDSFGIVRRPRVGTFEITELPVAIWTQDYKTSVLNPMINKSEIGDYLDNSTDTDVNFLITTANQQQVERIMETGPHKFFKLRNPIGLLNMVLYDEAFRIRHYSSTEEIMRNFYEVRLDAYTKRKRFLERKLQLQSTKLSNQARFILEKIQGQIILENTTKQHIMQVLRERGYDPDPVGKMKEEATLETVDSINVVATPTEDSLEQSLKQFDYLLSMSIIKLSAEDKEKLLHERDDKLKELERVSSKTPSDMWLEDLHNLEESLQKDVRYLASPLSSTSSDQDTIVQPVARVISSKKIYVEKSATEKQQMETCA